MSRIYVHGLGVVSPAGWGVTALGDALKAGVALPVQSLVRPGWAKPIPVRAIPAPAVKPAFLAHARLRRASPSAHYAVAAALEALGGDAALVQAGALKLGIVACTMTGGISYSRRFYQEVLHEPATASPLIFPETVFNAPTSHLAAYLNAPLVNYSMVGDAGTFLQGAAVAAQWLEDGGADACLLIGAEELDWTGADALRRYDRRAIYTAGAGILYLKKTPPAENGVELARITDSLTATRRAGCADTMQRVRQQLNDGGPDEFLCANGSADSNWPGWTGNRVDVRAVLGEAFVAGAAWQCVAACHAILQWRGRAANVMLGGVGQQSIGARFISTNLAK